MDEHFAAFKDSFSYGSRSDLSFKFLKKLSPERAAEAIRQILEAIGTTFDTGSVDELHGLVVAWQAEAYLPAADAPRTYVYETGPFSPLSKPLADSKVGLLTSSGHFVAGDDPEPLGVAHMTQVEAEQRISEFMREAPALSEIPWDIAKADLRVRHGGYDIRSAVVDFNVAFPRDPLVQAVDLDRIGSVAETFYSFPGATSQRRLQRDAIPDWVERFHTAAIDVLLLVPV